MRADYLRLVASARIDRPFRRRDDEARSPIKKAAPLRKRPLNQQVRTAYASSHSVWNVPGLSMRS